MTDQAGTAVRPAGRPGETMDRTPRVGSGDWIRQNVLLHSLGISITVFTFIFDLVMPLGVAAAIPYSLLVLLSLRSPSYALTWFAAGSASVLTLLGFLLSPPGGEMWKVLLNRALALFVIWMTAYLCFVQKRKSERIEEERLKLIQADKMATLGEVAAGIAHELGNPLAAIQGHVERLDPGPRPQPVEQSKVGEIAGTLSQLTDRMVQIIRGMRSFARDASGDPLQKATLSHVIRDVLLFSQERLRALDIDVRVECPDGDLSIPCRESQISQVLVNLLANSIDAIKDLPDRWIRIDLLDRGETAEIAFTDSGPGIPRKIQDQVMTPFFTTKEAGRGTGLGLSISRSLVEGHGGTLRLDKSAPNTRFVISLPRRQALSS